MKKFSEMTQAEINAMSDEDFKAVSPFEKRSCFNCSSLTSYVSLWCLNDKAYEFRGTRIPGGIKCLFWTPDWKEIDDKYKTEENGYVKPAEILPQSKKKNNWFSFFKK